MYAAQVLDKKQIHIMRTYVNMCEWNMRARADDSDEKSNFIIIICVALLYCIDVRSHSPVDVNFFERTQNIPSSV